MGFLIAAIVIVLILSLRISVRIRAGDEMKLVAGVGFIRLTLFPRPEKTLRLRDFEITRWRKKQEKANKPKPKKKSKNKPKVEKTEQAEQPEQPKKKLDILDLVRRILRTAVAFVTRFGHHLRINIREFTLIIATGDAAKTAIMYGAAIGIVQNLYAVLYSTGNLRTNSRTVMNVAPDFLGEKPTVRVDLTFSFRLWQLFDMLIRAGIAFLKKAADSG
ncbi:MAG: DUF2953 domain-containing protein [Clostridiales bacterium]|nr:DUF2953 domain-containing protein [Clostridiales bacterium]